MRSPSSHESSAKKSMSPPARLILGAGVVGGSVLRVAEGRHGNSSGKSLRLRVVDVPLASVPFAFKFSIGNREATRLCGKTNPSGIKGVKLVTGLTFSSVVRQAQVGAVRGGTFGLTVGSVLLESWLVALGFRVSRCCEGRLIGLGT